MTEQECLMGDVLSLRDEVKRLLKTKNRYEEEIIGIESKLKGQIDEAKNTLGGIISALNAEIVSRKKEKQDLDSKILDGKNELENLVKLKRNHSEEYEKFVVKNNKLVSDYGILKNSFNREVSDLKIQIGSLKTEIQTAVSKRAIAETELSVVSEKLSRTLNLVEFKEKRIKKLIDKIKKLSEDLKRINYTKQVLTEDILSERGYLLLKRHKYLTGMNNSLDLSLAQKKILLK